MNVMACTAFTEMMLVYGQIIIASENRVIWTEKNRLMSDVA